MTRDIMSICRLFLGLISGLALSFFVVATHAADDDATWTPHTLSTTPPAARPLGCREKATQLSCKPTVDVSSLPALEEDKQYEDNPYHGDADVAAVGHKLFNQTCARCHGKDAKNYGAVAADLTRLNSACVRVTDEALRKRCERDVDAFYRHRVKYGKSTFGIVQMPAWSGTLNEKQIWAIKTFIESRSAE